MKTRTLYILLILLSGLIFPAEKAYTQKKVSVHLQNRPLKELLHTIQKNERLYLYVDPSVNIDKNISVSTEYSEPLTMLSQVDNTLSYRIIDNTHTRRHSP